MKKPSLSPISASCRRTGQGGVDGGGVGGGGGGGYVAVTVERMAYARTGDWKLKRSCLLFTKERRSLT